MKRLRLLACWVNRKWWCEFHSRTHFQMQDAFQKCLHMLQWYVPALGRWVDSAWLLQETEWGVFGAGEASRVGFFRRLCCNLALSMVSRGPQRVLVAPCKFSLTFITYCPLLLCLHHCAVWLWASMYPVILQDCCYRVQWGICLPPATTGLCWTGRAHSEFAPAHKC